MARAKFSTTTWVAQIGNIQDGIEERNAERWEAFQRNQEKSKTEARAAKIEAMPSETVSGGNTQFLLDIDG